MYMVKEGTKPFSSEVSYYTLSITFARILFCIIYYDIFYFIMLQSISLVEIHNTICLLILNSIIVALNKNSNKDKKCKKKVLI